MSQTVETLDREWSRFTLSQRLGRYFTYLILVAAVVWALRTVEIIPEFLYDAPEQMAALFTVTVGVCVTLIANVLETTQTEFVVNTVYIAVVDGDNVWLGPERFPGFHV